MTLPFSFGVTPPTAGEPRVVVEAEALPACEDPTGPVVRRAVRTGFLSEQTLLVVLFLPDSCTGCADTESCDDSGACVPTPDVEPSSFPPVLPGQEIPDAGPDACGSYSGADPFALGDGSEGAPHLLCTGAQLSALATSSEGWDRHYRVVRPLDASTLATPIGSGSMPFTGVFDGGRQPITGLALNGERDMGLFGFARSATLRDVVVEGSVVASAANAGLLVGRCESCSVSNARVQLSGSVEASAAAGGMAGRWVGGSVAGARVESSAGVEVRASTQAGGLIGSASGSGTPVTISDALATVDVRATTYAGGLVGQTARAELVRCEGTGDVFGATEPGDCSYVGGLIGRGLETTIQECVARGAIETRSAAAGGLVGWLEDGAVVDSYATGTVDSGSVMVVSGGCSTVGGHGYGGGLLGVLNGSTVTRSWASSHLLWGGLSRGGLVGLSTGGSVTASFATGPIDLESPDGMFRHRDYFGGIVGQNLGGTAYTSVYWDRTVSEVTRCGGCDDGNGIDTSVVPDYFWQASSPPMTTWDFETVWRERQDGPPNLRWE